METDAAQLNRWFVANKRVFPWRENPTAYRVWISEVMLQQTRAVAVIPYFERWMQLFPDVHSLADATEEQVIKAWEGLGYYSRARNIHKAAQRLVLEYKGEFPNTYETLIQLPGFGPYTTAAVLSFAFHQKVAAVDGNVTRVISRFAWIEGDVRKTWVQEQITNAANHFLCNKTPWVTAEALIELGATICTPHPRCEICPLSSSCQAALQKNPAALPIKSCPSKIEKISRGVAVVQAKDKILLRKNSKGKVMEGLYEFPYFDAAVSLISVQQKLSQLLNTSVDFVEKLKPVEHSFTRYRAKLFPFYFTTCEAKEVEEYLWVSMHQLPNLSFSSGHRKILSLINNCFF